MTCLGPKHTLIVVAMAALSQLFLLICALV